MNRPLRPAVAGLALLLSLPIHATGQESEIGITAEVRVQNGDVLRARLLQESLLLRTEYATLHFPTNLLTSLSMRDSLGLVELTVAGEDRHAGYLPSATFPLEIFGGAALKFLKHAMKRYGRPDSIVTDRLRSYRAAMNAIGNAAAQTCGRWLNNRAENSHQPFRRREGAMARFRDLKTLQKFASVHASIHNHSHGKWLVKGRINSLCTWPFSAVIGSKSEPLSTTRPFAEPVKLTSGRRSHRLHQHPAFGGGGSGGRDHSSTRLFQPNGCPVRPPGSGEADQAPRNRIGDITNC